MNPRASSAAKHFAVVTSSYPSDDDDAAGHFVRTEVRQQLARGHAVTVFAPSARRSAGNYAERIIGIEHAGAFGSPGALARLRGHPARWIGAARFALHTHAQLFARRDFDGVNAHFILPSYWPIAAGHPCLSRVVVHGSDLRLLERVPGALRARVLARLKKDNPIIQCVSNGLAERVDALTHGRLHSRIEVQPPPIDFPQLPSKSELRTQLGFDGRPLIVIVARLIPSKRVDVAVQAALHVPGAQIVVCGGGPLYESLSRSYPSVTFLGQVSREQTLRWIAAADALLSASRTEGAPTAIREARALGVPVVTTAAGDLLEWSAVDAGLHVIP